MAVVGGAGHAGEVADDAAGHRGREPVVPAGEIAGHVPAVAVAGDGQPGGVGDARRDEVVDRLEEVLRVGLTPPAERGVPEPLAVPVAAARVQQQDRPAACREFLVVEVYLVGGAVPGVVRAAVDVQQ
jgi:hypothetical protein